MIDFKLFLKKERLMMSYNKIQPACHCSFWPLGFTLVPQMSTSPPPPSHLHLQAPTVERAWSNHMLSISSACVFLKNADSIKAPLGIYSTRRLTEEKGKGQMREGTQKKGEKKAMSIWQQTVQADLAGRWSTLLPYARSHDCTHTHTTQRGRQGDICLSGLMGAGTNKTFWLLF